MSVPHVLERPGAQRRPCRRGLWALRRVGYRMARLPAWKRSSALWGTARAIVGRDRCFLAFRSRGNRSRSRTDHTSCTEGGRIRPTGFGARPDRADGLQQGQTSLWNLALVEPSHRLNRNPSDDFLGRRDACYRRRSSVLNASNESCQVIGRASGHGRRRDRTGLRGAWRPASRGRQCVRLVRWPDRGAQPRTHPEVVLGRLPSGGVGADPRGGVRS